MPVKAPASDNGQQVVNGLVWTPRGTFAGVSNEGDTQNAKETSTSTANTLVQEETGEWVVDVMADELWNGGSLGAGVNYAVLHRLEPVDSQVVLLISLATHLPTLLTTLEHTRL